MRPLRGAVIGFGNAAAHGHWPALSASPDVEMVAAVDPSPSRRAAAAALAPGLRTYASVDDLAANEALDFVDIAAPPAAHVPLAEVALARGWHVLCEKPLALDPTAFGRLARSARAGGRALFTVHNWKVAPIFQAAFRALACGRVGAVRQVDLVVLRNQPCKGASPGGGARTVARAPEDWRQDPEIAGGGVLVDHGWHNLYLLLALAGEEPERVWCALTRPAGDVAALDDSARLAIAFPSAHACIHLTWRAAVRRNAAALLGDRGAIVVDDDRLIVSPRGAAPETTVFPSALSAGSHHEDWFRALLPQFVAEVRDPAARGANLREAGWCVALLDAAYRSAAEGREVTVVPPGSGETENERRKTENGERKTENEEGETARHR